MQFRSGLAFLKEVAISNVIFSLSSLIPAGLSVDQFEA
jgi:hypothetical protein